MKQPEDAAACTDTAVLETEDLSFAYGGNAMTFNPNGDPAGPRDGFPGSLFIRFSRGSAVLRRATALSADATRTVRRSPSRSGC